ncbi:MAG: response regulator [Deltaproteobacteria bacterium]|nr:response regulator [Deltaproteobacteria bacterium]
MADSRKPPSSSSSSAGEPPGWREIDIAATQERVALALQALSGVMYDFDAKRGTTVRSSGLSDLLGFHPREAAADVRWWNDRIHPQDQTRVQQAFDEAQSHCQVEYRIMHRDGHYVHVWDHALILRDESGAVQRIVGSNLNISRFKEVEKFLNDAYSAERGAREAAEQTAFRLTRLQRITHALSQALTTEQVAAIVLDELSSLFQTQRGLLFVCWPDPTSLTLLRSSGFALRANPKALALNAKNPFSEAVRAPDAVVLDGLDFDSNNFPELQEFFSEPWTGCLLTLPLISGGKPLGVLSFEVPCASVPEEEQQLLRIISAQCAQALERAKLYESELRARQQAEAANRTKDQFFATVSHELRSPLQSILGWIRLARGGKLDSATSEKALEVIERNTRSQVQLVSDMLEISRILTGKISMSTELLSIGAALEGSVDSVRPTALNKGLQLHVHIEPGLPLVWGDPNRLQQVFWNLLSNAIKFTPNAGSITVRARSRKEFVEIEVQDTGEGIPEEFLAHVFERFSQADESRTRVHGGLGLGLAIVRHIVELHAGRVSVHSDGRGKGSTFRILLPVRAEASTGVESGEIVRREGVLQGVRVLVVEDTFDTREFITTVLRNEGAQVRHADSAPEAIDMLRAFRPQVLLSDIGMPGTDGFQLLAQIREIHSENELPAAALTAYTTPEDQRRALAAGFQLHLSKPIEPDALIQAVETLHSLRAPMEDNVITR